MGFIMGTMATCDLIGILQGFTMGFSMALTHKKGTFFWGFSYGIHLMWNPTRMGLFSHDLCLEWDYNGIYTIFVFFLGIYDIQIKVEIPPKKKSIKA